MSNLSFYRQSERRGHKLIQHFFREAYFLRFFKASFQAPCILSSPRIRLHSTFIRNKRRQSLVSSSINLSLVKDFCFFQTYTTPCPSFSYTFQQSRVFQLDFRENFAFPNSLRAEILFFLIGATTLPGSSPTFPSNRTFVP